MEFLKEIIKNFFNFFANNFLNDSTYQGPGVSGVKKLCSCNINDYAG